MFASRLWWLLRWLGHDEVAVLNGGFAKWMAEGRPTAIGSHEAPARIFTPAPRPGLIVPAAEVARLIGDPDWTLLDVRAPERYRGDVEPIDRVAGHIPSAVNCFHGRSVNEQGVFRAPEDLRALLQRAIGDRAADHVVCYCGSGVTACQTVLALELAGLPGAKLYPGSWSEWSSDPARPVERSGDQ
jgi:thiosulfate/3-mercaptopyruvate sulfurtransferase